MPQISKKKISSKNQKKMNTIFGGVLEAVGKNKEVGVFVDSFFTKTEKIMFSKRLVSQVLLVGGWSVLEVSRALSMSDATVYKLGGYLDRDNELFDLMKKYSKRLKISNSKKLEGSGAGELLDELMDVFTPINWKRARSKS